MRVINLISGPGRGKSTTASGLFYKMKINGLNVELVNEYAKDMTWENRQNILKDQLYIFAKQNRKLERLRNKVDYVITDSPLILGLAYTHEEYPKSFEPFVIDIWNTYNNINFYLSNKGDLTYQQIGRNQDKFEAEKINKKILDFVHEKSIDYKTVMVQAGNEDMSSNHINFLYEEIINAR